MIATLQTLALVLVTALTCTLATLTVTSAVDLTIEHVRAWRARR